MKFRIVIRVPSMALGVHLRSPGQRLQWAIRNGPSARRIGIGAGRRARPPLFSAGSTAAGGLACIACAPGQLVPLQQLQLQLGRRRVIRAALMECAAAVARCRGSRHCNLRVGASACI
jgi:hypothetical protein